MIIERSKDDYCRNLGHQCIVEGKELNEIYVPETEKNIHKVTQKAMKVRKIWSNNLLGNREVLNLCYQRLLFVCDLKTAPIVFEEDFGNTNDLSNLARAELRFINPHSVRGQNAESFVTANNEIWVEKKIKKRNKMFKMLILIFIGFVIMILTIIMILPNSIKF